LVSGSIQTTLHVTTERGSKSSHFHGISLETPCASGWRGKAGSQLYVNLGIGTAGFPIRLGARPEITVLELTPQD
jgi:predicted MPP superfamily phosphohydrolase